MAKLSDIKKSINEISRDDALTIINLIRTSRLVKKASTKKAPVSQLPKAKKQLTKMSPEMKAMLLKQIEELEGR